MKSRKVVAKGKGKNDKNNGKRRKGEKKGGEWEEGMERQALHLGSRGFDATRSRQYVKERKRRINCISVAVGPGRHDEI